MLVLKSNQKKNPGNFDKREMLQEIYMKMKFDENLNFGEYGIFNYIHYSGPPLYRPFAVEMQMTVITSVDCIMLISHDFERYDCSK